MKTRYECIIEPTDRWSIFDMDSGVPVIIDTKLMIGLTREEAEEALARLNAESKKRKRNAA